MCCFTYTLGHQAVISWPIIHTPKRGLTGMEVVTHGMIGDRINIKKAELALLYSALFLHFYFVPTIERGRHVSPKIEKGHTGWEKEL